MDRQLYSSLNDGLMVKLKDWTPDNIPFEIDGGVSHNLSDYIGKECCKAGCDLQFPKAYNMDTTQSDDYNKKKQDDLIRSLKIAASDAGFTLVCKGWNRCEQKLYFKCQQSFLYDDKRKKKKDKESSTIRPVNKHSVCPFGFSVLWDNNTMCFKMKGGLGCCLHSHHLPKDPLEVRRGLGFQDEEQRQLSIDMYASGADSQTVRNYYFKKHGDILADSSLDHLRRTALTMKDKACAFAVGDDTGDGGKNLTEAQKLLQLLLEKVMPELVKRLEMISLQELEATTSKPVDTSMGLPSDQSTTGPRKKPWFSPTKPKRKRTQTVQEKNAFGANKDYEYGSIKPFP